MSTSFASTSTNHGGSGITKSGAGTLIMTLGNSYTGTTTVSAGALVLENTGALGATDALSITGGTVGFSGINSMSLASLAGSAATILQLTNSANSTGLNLTVAGATSTVYNGNITGSGGSLTMNGPGTLTLSGTNTYTGTTTLGGGLLVLNNAHALDGGGPINFTGGTLRLFNTTDYSSRFLTTGNQNPYRRHQRPERHLRPPT